MQKITSQKITNVLLNLGFVILITLIIVACAKQANPTGGPKDELPPVPLKSSPINYSTNFNNDKIIILFDEFIVLKNANQEVLVSPPLNKKPEIKLRGKSIIIKLADTLRKNTTYGINFHSAIADLNEGNVLQDFAFEFSTGNTFDSLYLKGNVKNAFNFKPEEGWYVMLYDKFDDSIPRKQKPELISKTDKNGNFLIANMKDKPYYIFAVKDLNNNMLFDLPSEKIAFCDTTFKPSFKQVEFIDTLVFIDSISPNLKDTIFYDSISTRKEYVTTIENVQLFGFQEDYKLQFFKKAYRFAREQVIFTFNRPITDSASAFPIINNKCVKGNWFVQESNSSPDSLVYWIKDSNIFKHDSLFFQLNQTLLDSNKQKYIKTDTLLLTFKDKQKKKAKKSKLNIGNMLGKNKEEKKDTTPPPSPLTFETNAKSALDLDANVFFNAKFPLSKVNTDKIKFVKIVDDTVENPMEYTLIQDSLSIKKANLIFKKEENEHFKLTIPPHSFTDIYNNTNDTLTYDFKTQKLKHYGTIKLEIINVKEHSILQLLTKDEKLVREMEIDSDTTINYKYLQPKKYIIKLYYDTNRNKKWDTGNYKEKRQPEQVFYLPNEIEVISNFDYDYKWDLYPIPSPIQYTKTDTIKVKLPHKTTH